jgi:hypothetical protein
MDELINFFNMGSSYSTYTRLSLYGLGTSSSSASSPSEGGESIFSGC